MPIGLQQGCVPGKRVVKLGAEFWRYVLIQGRCRSMPHLYDDQLPTAGALSELRKSGIEALGNMPLGTHFCHFYGTKQDLVDILVPFFKAGLETPELKKAKDDLRALSEQLEQRVTDRTIALEEANGKLQTEIADRERAENSLQESEERFRQFAENLHDVFWMCSRRRSRTSCVKPRQQELEIAMVEQPEEFILTITDEGEGLPEEVQSRKLSLGILGMKERAHLLGGSVDITSGVGGRVTTVTVRVPTPPPKSQFQ
jgi:PAS domain-containing protein